MSRARPETLEQIKTLLRRDLKLGPDIEISDEMPFSGSDVDFDSLDILLLLTSIEKQFKIKVPSEAVGKEIFRNVSTLAAYLDEQTQSAGAKPDSADYLQRLPHRDPFRFISRVTQIKQGESGEAVWTLRGIEPFFAGHFPGQPVVPGVLIAEALAQLSGIVGTAVANAGAGGKLAHIDVRFDQPIMPPAEIVLRSRLERVMGDLQRFEVSASVGQTSVARGTLTLNRAPGADRTSEVGA